MTMSKVISTDEAVYRIIHHKNYRKLFLDGRFDKMNISETTIEDLRVIDKEQLCASASRIARKLLSGSHQGSRGLDSIFEETFTAWTLQTHREKIDLIFDFLESDFYEKYHEVPFIGEGLCIEQAFYEFIKNNIWKEGTALEGVVRNEFLLSLFKTLSKTKEPSFIVDQKYIKKNAASTYSVQLYEYRLNGDEIERKPHFVLYSTSGGQLICGEITPLIADILFHGGRSPFQNMGEVLKRHNVSIQTFLNTCNQLIRMGVIPHAA